jgi:ribosomal protein S18 acetylase RimI-like enzyme
MLTIRAAVFDDLKQVVDLWDRAGGPTRHAGRYEEATALLEWDQEALLVALDDDWVIGTVIVGWDGWRCHLYRLAVDPAFRRRGVARSLLVTARRRAVALGAVRMDAMVGSTNETAVAFWEAEDFKLESGDGRFSLIL